MLVAMNLTAAHVGKPALPTKPASTETICDQLEDPKLAKKLVKRGITEMVTPGVSLNDNILEHRENNFLACVHIDKSAAGVAFLDISTGEFYLAQG